ncbi:MAG: serine/threonine-protein kinase [Anaerolineae bacterium]
MITCPNCGFGENLAQARFCAQCAASLQGDPASASDLLPPVMERETARGQTLAVNAVLQGHYAILSKLSEGGMGAVYLAQDTRLFNKLCVVKEMLPFYTTDEERRIAERNFEREARTLAHLRHPGIPEIYDFFVEDDRYYLVMAFVEGEDLGKVFVGQAQPFTEDEIVRFGLQMARVLSYLASLNPPVMHRDIKPGNIILEKATGQLKLVDFGIARESLGSERLEATGSIIMGTRGYAPPEQFAGQASPASDIYALGATLHHLATGQHPLRAAAPFQFASLRGRRPDIGTALDSLILEMARFDASLRPTAEDVKQRLERMTGTQVASTAFVMRNGAEVYSAGELVQACERSPETGRFHLQQGHIRDWFLGQNRHDLAGWADRCLAEAPDDRIALEWFLRVIESDLPAPQLKMEEAFIDFGEVERDSSYSLLVPFSNDTRGYLVVAAASHVPWLRVETEYAGCYAGEQGQIQVTLDTRSMPEGMYTQDALALAWEQEQMRLPARLKVTWPPGGQMAPLHLDFGLVLDNQGLPMRQLTLRNTGGSDWVGRLQTDTPWLSVQGGTFRIPLQREMALPVTVHMQRLRPGELHEGTITLISNGGSQAATAAIRLGRSWYLGRSRLRRWLAFAAPSLLSAAGFAVCMAYLAKTILGTGASSETTLYVLAGLGAWILGLLVAGVFAPALDEMENFHHRSDLAFDLTVSRFRPGRALWTMIVGGTAGLAAGSLADFFVGMADASQTRLGLLGLVAGALVGGLARAGSSDVMLGQQAVLNQEWLAQRPALLALLRSVLVGLSLALLSSLWGIMRGQSGLVLAGLAALVGLVITSDGYPYLPLRLRQGLGWLRPTLLVALYAGAGYVVAVRLLLRLSVSAPAETLSLSFFSFIILAAWWAGATVGLASHDEVGFAWQAELRRSWPLAVLLLITAALLFALVRALVDALLGEPIGWLSQALTLAGVGFLALGLSGQSQTVRRWLEQARTTVTSWLTQVQISGQVQNLVEQQVNPRLRLTGNIWTSPHHPVMLASVVVVSVLSAPAVIDLFGAVAGLLALLALAGGMIWYVRRSQQAATGAGGRI